MSSLARHLALALLGLLAASCALFRSTPPDYDAVLTDSGLIVQDTVIPLGGEVVNKGDWVGLDYIVELEDGTQVDSSRDRGEPIRFRLGDGQVPAGLDEGVVGMRLFGERILIVPPALAYGAEGRPPLIPPDSTLVFRVELLELERQPRGH